MPQLKVRPVRMVKKKISLQVNSKEAKMKLNLEKINTLFIFTDQRQISKYGEIQTCKCICRKMIINEAGCQIP